MDFHEDMKDVSIAMVSTSALLLTILAVVHISYGKWSFLAILTVFGLYMTIALGVIEFYLLILTSRERGSKAREVTYNTLMKLFLVQILMFVLGLLGISITVIVASLS